MARRSPTMPGHALPAGGRSSGSRPKTKFKVKKSRARRDAESDVKAAERGRKAAKRAKDKSPNSKTVLARTPKKQAAASRQKARKAGSMARRTKNYDTMATAEDNRSYFQTKADTTTAKSVARARKASRHYKTGADRGETQQRIGKKLIKARKTLAKTPKQGGTYRTGSNRNRYLMDPKHSQH